MKVAGAIPHVPQSEKADMSSAFPQIESLSLIDARKPKVKLSAQPSWWGFISSGTSVCVESTGGRYAALGFPG